MIRRHDAFNDFNQFMGFMFWAAVLVLCAFCAAQGHGFTDLARAALGWLSDTAWELRERV